MNPTVIKVVSLLAGVAVILIAAAFTSLDPTARLGLVALGGFLCGYPLKAPGTPPAALVLLLALGVAPELTGCASGPAKSPDTDALVSRSAALAYNGAAQAVLYFDQKEAAHAATLNSTMTAELAASEKRVVTLEHAKAALDIVRGWLEGKNSEDEARAGMRDGVAALKLLVAEYRNQGKPLPTEVDVGLAAAEAYVRSL